MLSQRIAAIDSAFMDARFLHTQRGESSAG